MGKLNSGLSSLMVNGGTKKSGEEKEKRKLVEGINISLL